MYSNAVSKYCLWERYRSYQRSLLLWQFSKSHMHRVVSVSSKVNALFSTL